MGTGPAENVEPWLSIGEPRNLHGRALTLEQLGQESSWSRIAIRKRSICWKEHQELRLPRPPWRPRLDVLHFHHEPALGVGHCLANPVGLGGDLEGGHPLSPPHRP